MGLGKLFSRLIHPEDELQENPAWISNPMDGDVVDITKVADKVFADKILGDGMAVIPQDGRLYAPADGTVENLPETLHALCINADNGAELLLHIGRDTVELKGRHFTCHVQNGQKVKRGKLLIEFDLAALNGEGYDMASPVIVTNGGEFQMEKTEEGEKAHGERLFKLTKKR